MYRLGYQHAYVPQYPDPRYQKNPQYWEGWNQGIRERVSPLVHIHNALVEGMIACGEEKKEATNRANAMLGILPYKKGYRQGRNYGDLVDF